MCLCVTLLVAGCDRRKYSTNVYSSPTESADSVSGLQSDPAAAVSTTGGTTSASAGDTTGGTTGDTTGDTTSASAGDTTNETTVGSIDGNPVVDPSSTLQGTVTGADAATQPGTIPEPETTLDPVADALDTEESEPPEPAVLPAPVPAAVPQGPGIDRIGSGSIYQPVSDEETATFTIDGRRSQALAAEGGPVLQSPRALMEEIDEYFLNDLGQVAFTGRFSADGESAYGVWAGDVNSPVQIFQTGTAIPGMADGQTYFKTLKLAFDDDGTLAQLVNMQADATMTQAYMVSRGAEHRVLMRSNSSMPGLIGPVQISSIEVMDQVADRHALVSIERIETKVPVESDTINSSNDEDPEEPEMKTVVTPQYSVWYISDGNTKAVAHSKIETAQNAPTLANGCRIYAPDNTVDNRRLGVTRNAGLIFQAQVGGDGNCEKGRAVLRFTGNGYREVLKDGDGVPGSASHVFNDVSLYTVTYDGSAIVFANLLTTESFAEVTAAGQVESDDETSAPLGQPGGSEGEEIDDGKWSFWIMPPQGGARLIALEGEEIQVGPSISVFSGETRDLSLRVNDSNQFAFRLLLDGTDQPVFFVGAGHAGQPHTTIDIPGASSLRYAFTGNSTLPGQSDDAVLGELGTPDVDRQGNLVIYGEVKPSEQALDAALQAASNQQALSIDPVPVPLVRPFNSLWQVDASGTMRELVRSGDRVVVAGVSKPIASLSVAGQIARPGTTGVRVNSAGALLVRATIERKFGNAVLLYIAP